MAFGSRIASFVLAASLAVTYAPAFADEHDECGEGEVKNEDDDCVPIAVIGSLPGLGQAGGASAIAVAGGLGLAAALLSNGGGGSEGDTGPDSTPTGTPGTQ